MKKVWPVSGLVNVLTKCMRYCSGSRSTAADVVRAKLMHHARISAAAHLHICTLSKSNTVLIKLDNLNVSAILELGSGPWLDATSGCALFSGTPYQLLIGYLVNAPTTQLSHSQRARNGKRSALRLAAMHSLTSFEHCTILCFPLFSMLSPVTGLQSLHPYVFVVFSHYGCSPSSRTGHRSWYGTECPIRFF